MFKDNTILPKRRQSVPGVRDSSTERIPDKSEKSEKSRADTCRAQIRQELEAEMQAEFERREAEIAERERSTGTQLRSQIELEFANREMLADAIRGRQQF